MRQTKQKQIILDKFLEHNGHLTAEALYSMLKPEFPKLSLATVYRNLNQYADQGLITRLDLPNIPTHFDVTTSQHFHAICECCGALMDVDVDHVPTLEQIDTGHAFKATRYNLVFYGICKDCQDSLEQAKHA